MKSAENLFLFSFFYYQHQQLVSITTSTDNCQPKEVKFNHQQTKSLAHKNPHFFFQDIKVERKPF